MNLVTPEAGAKHEFLFNKPVSGLRNLCWFIQKFSWLKHREYCQCEWTFRRSYQQPLPQTFFVLTGERDYQREINYQ